MKEKILKPDASDEYDTRERCSILELSNESDDGDVSIARCRVKSGVITEWHVLDGIAERYVILSGSGRMEVGDLAPRVVCAEDVVCIPPGVRQRITNLGAGDLIFLAVCTPRFYPESYIGTHITRGKFPQMHLV